MHRAFPLVFVTFIALVLSQSPGPIVLRDPQGNVVNEVRVTMLISMGVYKFECDVEKGRWAITPTLPAFMRFDSSDLTLSGTVRSVFPKQQFNITVTNDSGSSSLLFYVEAVYCDEGFYTIRHIEDGSQGSFLLEHNGVILEESSLSLTMKDSYFCIPKGNLKFTVNCTSSWTGSCTGSIHTDDNTTFVFVRAEVGHIEKKETSMIAQNPPILTVNKESLIIHSSEGVELLFSATGIFSNVTFNPPLPESLTFNQYSLALKGYVKEKGRHTFVASSRNEKGENSVTFSIYMDACPDQLVLLQFSRDIGGSDGYRITTLGGEQLANVSNLFHYHKKNFCFPSGEYYLYMRSEEGTTTWQDSLNLQDEKGLLLESFQKTSSEFEQQERFVVGDIVPMGSTFRYSLTFSDKWTQKNFNGKNWKEGSSGTWGQYEEGATVYFRHQFSISNPAKYSLINLEMVLQDEAIVYLNGKEVNRVSPSLQTSTVFALFPASYLVKKVNQLAISLHRSTSHSIFTPTDISFDIRLHLSTSQCLIPSIEGHAYDDEPNPDPDHPADQAFTESYVWWQSTTLPVNLYYNLYNDTFITPSLFRIGSPSTLDGRPRAFRVFGRIVDSGNNNTVLVEDEIASIDSPTFFVQTDVEMVQLTSKRPYNSFRILFTDTANHTLLRTGYMQFTMCQEAYCKKKIGWPSALVGNTVTGRCPFGYYGQNHRICGRQDVEPVWIDDSSMCLANYASKGYAFIDTGIRIDGIRDTAMKKFETAAVSVVCSNLTVWKDQISFPIVIMNTDDSLSLDIVMRFTVEQEIGDYVLKKMKHFQNSLVEEMKEGMQGVSGFIDLTITSKPTLRLPFPWSTLVIVAVCILAVLLSFVFGLFCMYMHSRSGKEGGPKQLKKKKNMKQEQTSLLEETV